MKVTRSSSTSGAWLDKKTVSNGDKIKIVSEPLDQPSQQEGKTQLVCKVLVQGKSKEPVNFAINTQSKNALIDQYGDDTVEWMNKIFTAHVERVLIAGKRGTAVYLVPDGMVVKESEEGFIYIGHKEEKADSAPSYPPEEVNPDDIPF